MLTEHGVVNAVFIVCIILSAILDYFNQLDVTTALISDEGYILDTFSSQNDSYAWKVADINNDGLNDLIVVEDYRTLRIYFQNKKHELNSTPLRISLNVQYVYIVKIPYTGDLNGDGRTDIAILSSYPPFWHEEPPQRRTIIILYQRQNMTFSLYKYYVGEWESTALFGDVNNDDEDDIILFKDRPYRIEVYLNRNGLFYDYPDESLTFNTTMYLDDVLDFDLDGWADLMLFDTKTSTIYYAKNIQGVFDDIHVYPVLKTLYPFGCVQYCKIDSDDFWDIIQLNGGYAPYNSNETYLWFAKGPLVYDAQPNYILHPGWNPFRAVFTDFNQDGRVDIAILNWGTYYHCGVEGHGYNITVFYQRDEGVFRDYPDLSLPVEHYTFPMEIGDLNHDGLDDIIVVEHNITVYYQYWPDWKIPPNVTLPEDFSVEYPTRISIAVGYEENFGRVVRFFWEEINGPPILNVAEEEFRLNFTPSSPGVYQFRICVEDEYHFRSSWKMINITVFPNKPPVVRENNIGIQMNEDETTAINLTTIITDSDEVLSFSILNDPEGIDIVERAEGVFSIIPAENLNGIYNISFLCKDQFLNEVVINVTLNITPSPDPPYIRAINGRSVEGGLYFIIDEGEKLLLNFTVEDPDLRWERDLLTLHSSWERFSIRGLTAELLPSQESVGRHRVTFWVTDRYNLSQSVNVTVEVMDVNEPPVLVVFGVKERINISETLTLSFNDSYDPDGDLIMFYIRIDNGSWISCGNLYTLKFRSPGVHVVEIKAEDINGGVTTRMWRVTVVEEESPGSSELPSRVHQGLIAVLLIGTATALTLFIMFLLRGRGRSYPEE